MPHEMKRNSKKKEDAQEMTVYLGMSEMKEIVCGFLKAGPEMRNCLNDIFKKNKTIVN